MEIFLWAAVFIALVLLSTWLLKRYAKAETWVVVSLVRTTRFLPLFDRLARAGKVLDWFADAGIVLGFGAIAVDYLWGRGLGKARRIALFIASFALLTAFFQGIDAALGFTFSTSPFTKDFFPVLALVFGFSGFAGFAIAALVVQALDIISKFSAGQGACPGVAPLIPGVEIPNVPITLPLHAWISLFIILAIHEGSHGIIARRNGFNVKSAGLLLFGFLPIGAFVEPDEEQVKRDDGRRALRLYAAGPTANLAALVAIEAFVLVVVLALAAFVAPWASAIHAQEFRGVEISRVDQNYEFCRVVYDAPAYGVLEKGMVIEKINDENMTSAAKLQLVIAQHRYEPLEFTLRDADGSISKRTITPNELGIFGFSAKERENPDYSPPFEYKAYQFGLLAFNDFIKWLFLLNLLIALVNFLPIAVFDGGRIATTLLLPYFNWLGMNKEDAQRIIGRIFLWAILALLLVNALPLFM